MALAQDCLRVGVITAPHGIKGEVKVYPTTDEPQMFPEWENLILLLRGKESVLHITEVKYMKQLVVLRFAEVEDRNAAELLRQGELYIRRDQAAPCGENEDFVADLIGMEVFLESGEKFGVCTDVLETGANDVYEVKRENGKTVLLPAIRSCILSTDVEENRMVVRIPEGLLS